jgi:hypothetical protein
MARIVNWEHLLVSSLDNLLINLLFCQLRDLFFQLRQQVRSLKLDLVTAPHEAAYWIVEPKWAFLKNGMRVREVM